MYNFFNHQESTDFCKRWMSPVPLHCIAMSKTKSNSCFVFCQNMSSQKYFGKHFLSRQDLILQLCRSFKREKEFRPIFSQIFQWVSSSFLESLECFHLNLSEQYGKPTQPSIFYFSCHYLLIPARERGGHISNIFLFLLGVVHESNQADGSMDKNKAEKEEALLW